MKTRLVTALVVVLAMNLPLVLVGDARAATPIARIVGVVEGGRPVATSPTAHVLRTSARDGVPAATGVPLFERDEIKSGKALLRLEGTVRASTSAGLVRVRAQETTAASAGRASPHPRGLRKRSSAESWSGRPLSACSRIPSSS